MPINPNDLARIISEMSKTLQEMGETHLKTVESILSEQIDLNKKTAKERELQEQRDAIAASNAKKQAIDKESLETKSISYQKDIAKLLLVNLEDSTDSFKKYTLKGLNKLGFGDTIEKIQTARKIINAPTEFLKSALTKKTEKKEIGTVSVKKDLLIKGSKFDTVSLSSKGSVFINSNKLSYKSQDQTTEEDFTRHDNDNPEQTELKLLRSIDDKLSKLKLGGDGGLFDLLAKGLPKLLSMAGTAATVGEAGAAGAAGVGIASKLGKWFPKLGKFGETAGKVLTKVKNPKVAIPLMAGTALLGGIGYMSSNEGADQPPTQTQPQEVEGRYSGGTVKKGTPYVVGEKGQELFMPDTNGTIIPNDKLKESSLGTKKSLLDAFKTVVGAVNTKFKSFKEIIIEAWQKIKNYVLGVYNNAKDTVKEKVQTVLSAPKTAFNYVKNLITGTPQETPTTPPPVGTQQVTNQILVPPATTQNNVGPSTPDVGTLPQRYHGEYNVPDTRLYKVHNDEMVVPAHQAEIVRSAAELNSNYSLPSSVPQQTKKMKLDEGFWINKFVPAFANAIKVDKRRDNKRNNFVSDAFGIL